MRYMGDPLRREWLTYRLDGCFYWVMKVSFTGAERIYRRRSWTPHIYRGTVPPQQNLPCYCKPKGTV